MSEQNTGRLNVMARILAIHADDLAQPGNSNAEQDVAFVLELVWAAIRLGRTGRLVAQVRGLQRVWGAEMKEMIGQDEARRLGTDGLEDERREAEARRREESRSMEDAPRREGEG